MRTIALLVVFGSGLFGTVAAQDAGAQSTAMSTRHTTPFTAAVNASLGRGVNMGNCLEAPSDGAWGVMLTERWFEVAKELGFDSIRLPVRWSSRQLAEAPYTIEPAFFERVDQVIAFSLDRGMPIIVNAHHYDGIFDDPAAHEARLISAWRQVAERYKDMPRDMVVFELLNEPHNNLTADLWNEMYPKLLAAVRETNPDRPVMIGPANWNAYDALSELEMPDDPNIIVTFHYYLPFRFTHQGAGWIDADAQRWLGTTWSGTPDELAAMRAHFDEVAAFAETHDVPINVGEFGAFSTADMDSRAAWTAAVRTAALDRGFSFHYWELGAGFGVWDPEADAVREPVRAALLDE
ncbi:MAG: glycoside hydrolase family 5 protein [Planctomycetota bacterium]